MTLSRNHPRRSHSHRVDFQRRNEASMCAVADCTRTRHGHSRYCRLHKQKVSLYRSPSGKAIPRETLRYHRKLFAEFLKVWGDHEVTVAAANALTSLIETPRLYTANPTVINELVRLHGFGLTGAGALSALAGTALAYHLERATTDEALPFLLARRLIGTKPRLYVSVGKFGLTVRDRAAPLRQPVTTQRTLGAILLKLVGGYFLRVAERIKSDQQAAQQRALAFHAPFDQPHVNPTAHLVPAQGQPQ
jgi:hypothetical protein